MSLKKCLYLKSLVYLFKELALTGYILHTQGKTSILGYKSRLRLFLGIIHYSYSRFKCQIVISIILKAGVVSIGSGFDSLQKLLNPGPCGGGL